MITITVTANVDRAGLDHAECTLEDGRKFAVVSGTGAIHALCRMLRNAGVADQPWLVPGRIKGGSIYWMADRGAVDTAAGVRTQRFNPYPFKTGGGQKGGAGDPDGGSPPPEAA